MMGASSSAMHIPEMDMNSARSDMPTSFSFKPDTQQDHSMAMEKSIPRYPRTSVCELKEITHESTSASLEIIMSSMLSRTLSASATPSLQLSPLLLSSTADTPISSEPCSPSSATHNNSASEPQAYSSASGISSLRDTPLQLSAEHIHPPPPGTPPEPSSLGHLPPPPPPPPSPPPPPPPPPPSPRSQKVYRESSSGKPVDKQKSVDSTTPASNTEMDQSTLNNILMNFDIAISKLSRVPEILTKEACEELWDVLLQNVEMPFHKVDHVDMKQAMANYLAKSGFVKKTLHLYNMILKSEDLKFITDYELNVDQPSRMFMMVLRSCLWNYSDNGYRFCKRLSESNLFELLVKDLHRMAKSASSITMRNIAFASAVGVLHNCAKYMSLRQGLRSIGVVDALIPFLQSQVDEVKMLILLSLVPLICKKHDSLLLADARVFDFIMRLLREALNDQHHRYEGFSAIELMSGLTGLAKNDDNKPVIVQKGALPLIKKMLIDGSDVERREAANAVWELAFNDKNKISIRTGNDKWMNPLLAMPRPSLAKLHPCFARVGINQSLHSLNLNFQKTIQNDTELMKLLNQTKDSHRHGRLLKACRGALWELRDESVQIGSPYRPKTSSKKKRSSWASSMEVASSEEHIMISYNHGDQKIIFKLRDFLESKGYRIWIDEAEMSGSTLDAMSMAVENSVAVLMCMSETYKESRDCRSEAEYAYKLHKPITPLLMQKDYKPDGWLGIILGTKFYYDFSGRFPFGDISRKLAKSLPSEARLVGKDGDTSFDVVEETPIEAEIVEEVDAMIPTDRPSSPAKITIPVDVQSWLKMHNLQHVYSLRELTNDRLHFLHKLSLKAPEFFYSYIQTQFRLTALEDLMRFSDAVESLNY